MRTNLKAQVALFILSIFASPTFAQGTLPSIAVSRPQVSGLSVEAITAEKMLRMEIAKLEMYTVYDEFDMANAIKKDSSFLENCQSQSCLIKMGKELGVDYMISGSYDMLGKKIVIQLKLVDVNQGKVVRTGMIEFDDQINELQRMTENAVKEIHGVEMSPLVTDRLNYQNDPITSNEVGKINNSGPRIGIAYMTGSVNEFATRSERNGGLDIVPAVSMIGYQFEGQYVGTENFSALVEVIINVSGMEQGQFIPTLNLMNGFRFGKAGWEIAFGPGIGIKKTTHGFFDNDGLFGDQGDYFSDSDWRNYADNTYREDPDYIDISGNYIRPESTDFNLDYSMDERHADSRGSLQLSTHFVFAIGRTFKAGALNLPVNFFYTAKKKGGMAGISIGFNVVKKKSKLKTSKTDRSKSSRPSQTIIY
ncbi:MAG: hypothetical protein ACI837_000782 [Crocinitomicaceae bacterium]|jgi:hypothetical protein